MRMLQQRLPMLPMLPISVLLPTWKRKGKWKPNLLPQLARMKRKVVMEATVVVVQVVSAQKRRSRSSAWRTMCVSHVATHAFVPLSTTFPLHWFRKTQML